MGEPLSLLAMYASAAERQTCDLNWYWWRNGQKANMWWIFKLRKLDCCRLFIKGWRHIMSCCLFVKGWRCIMSGRFIRLRMKTHKELPVVRWKTKNIIWDMEETQIQKVMKHWEKQKLLLWMNSNSEVWWTSLNEYPKKRFVHEKRNNN